MDYQHITLEKAGHITTLQFNRPDKANAVHYDHLCEIEHAVLSLRDDADTRAVIFCGAGKHFCSGADLTDSGDAYKVPLVQRRRRMRMGERVINAILDMDQISVAAWHGAAMGGGACIATACDFRIGADGCFMQYLEVDIGLNLMWQSLPLIIALAGPARAKRLVVGGERIHADRLTAWGVLDEQVAPSELMSEAHKFAAHYVAKPPVAAQMIKQSVNHISNALTRAVMHMDADQNMLVSGRDDRQAAVKAYLQGNQADFTGN